MNRGFRVYCSMDERMPLSQVAAHARRVDVENVDLVFLFGFSRGAFTARTLAALVDTVGKDDGGRLDDPMLRAELARFDVDALAFTAMSERFVDEMKAGKDKVSVLHDMGERCGVQDVSSFVTVLIQSAAFGTSIADALRERQVSQSAMYVATLPHAVDKVAGIAERVIFA